MFELKTKNDNYHILILKHDNLYNYDLDKEDYAYNAYSFNEILNLNVQIIENKILSYGAKYNQDEKYNIYYYFEDKEKGQQLVDELNIILRLEGE